MTSSAPEVIVFSSLEFGFALAAQLSLWLTPAFVSVAPVGSFLSASTSYPSAGCSSAEPASVSLDLYCFFLFCNALKNLPLNLV